MNEPKALLLHLDGTARCTERTALARHLAEIFDARVDAMYAVTPSWLRYPAVMDSPVGVPAELFELDQLDCERVRVALAQAGGGSSHFNWLELNGRDTADFARQALHADLLLLGQPDPADAGARRLPGDFLPTLLIETGRPALVLPYTLAMPPALQTVMLAWKPSRESARALDAALPLMRRAQQVHVVAHGAEAASSMHGVLRHLEAHGIAARTHRSAEDDGHAGEALLSEAADLGADLLVMGCYGHSRVREWVLGGATRTVLQSMTLPVLMVH